MFSLVHGVEEKKIHSYLTHKSSTSWNQIRHWFMDEKVNLKGILSKIRESKISNCHTVCYGLYFKNYHKNDDVLGCELSKAKLHDFF